MKILLTTLSVALTATAALAAPEAAKPDAKPAAKAAAPTLQDTDAARIGTLAPGTGLAVGTKIPAAQGKDLAGKEVTLASLHAGGAILIVFYRGGWCPFCNAQLHSLSTAYPEFQKRGVTPVAISVDRPEVESKVKALYSIPFPVLSDETAAIIDAFHVAKTVESKELQMLKGYGVDLEKDSGHDHHKIAVPSIFLVDRAGVVRWAHSETDYKVRPSTAQLLAAIDGAGLAGK